MCFANLGTCVEGYLLFEGSLLNPLQVTDDQYSIIAAVQGIDKQDGARRRAGDPRTAGVQPCRSGLDAHRTGHTGLPTGTTRTAAALFLIPLGIAVSLMLAALAVQIRLMLGAIILIPFLAALILGQPRAPASNPA